MEELLLIPIQRQQNQAIESQVGWITSELDYKLVGLQVGWNVSRITFCVTFCLIFQDNYLVN